MRSSIEWELTQVITTSNFHTLGNRSLLSLPKTAFLCSDNYSSRAVFASYDWAESMKKQNRCVISGFQSRLERDVLDILLRGSSPVILALARGLYVKPPSKFSAHLAAGRLLIFSQFSQDLKVITRERAYERNKLIMDIAEEVFIGYAALGGMTEKLIAQFSEKVKQL